jgi:bile acid:Na+ symporter, BASS family
MTVNSNKQISRLSQITSIYGRIGALALAMTSGILLPQAHSLSFLMPYLLIIMLFFSFLDIQISRGSFNLSVVWVLAANLIIALVAFAILRPFDLDLALAAFITGITPTAIAAPVIVGLLQRRVEYVISSVLLTNTVMAFVIPLLLPLIVRDQIALSTWQMLRSTLLVMVPPMVLALILSRLPMRVQRVVKRGKPLAFYTWLFSLFLVSSRASQSIFHELAAPPVMLLKIALTSLALCVINFGVGALIGGKQYRLEASQSLGQKNLSLTVWLALTFVSPIAALGPTFYVVCHNLVNALRLYGFEKRRRVTHIEPTPVTSAD